MKRKIDPLQPYCGTFRLGHTNVEVYGLTNSYGGEFYCAPDATSLPRLKVSFRYKFWWEVVAVLMHESFEFLASQKGVRWFPCSHHMNSSDIYSFHFDHNVFSQLIEDQAYFLAKALPEVATVWKKYRPKD